MHAMPEDEAMLYLACLLCAWPLSSWICKSRVLGSRGNLKHLARWLLAETAATANTLIARQAQI